MPASIIPSNGASVTASAQIIYQRRYVLEEADFLTGGVVGTAQGAPIRVSGLPKIRINILQFPAYTNGLSGLNGTGGYTARNYISWRPMAVFAPEMPPVSLKFSDGVFMPLAPIQPLYPGVPMTFDIPLGGVQDIGLQFDTSGGTPHENQGFDLIMYSITAAI